MTRIPPARRTRAKQRRFGVGIAIAMLVMLIGALVVPAIAGAEEASQPTDTVAASEQAPADGGTQLPDTTTTTSETAPDVTTTTTSTPPNDGNNDGDKKVTETTPLVAASSGGVTTQVVNSSASDSRATFTSGNVGNECVNAGLGGTTYTTGDAPSNGSTNVGGLYTVTIADYDAPGDVQSPFQILNGGVPAGDAQMLHVSGISANVTINGVVVKGGNGYNTYVFGTNAGYLGVNMIASLNGGGKVPRISHALVCYTETTPSTGSLTVTKTVSGPVSGGTTFTVTVSCPAAGSPLAGFPKTLIFNSSGVLTSGTLPITGIPTGTTCKVEETSTGGADSVSYKLNAGSGSSNPPTPIIAADSTQTVAVTNTYNEPQTGSLTVTKSVVGPVPADASFTVTVSCPADGTQLAGFPKTFTFNSSGVLTSGVLPITGIPAGTECKVEETGKGGADSVTYEVNGGSSSSTVPKPTIVADATQTVAVTNTFDETFGSLDVTKTVVGPVPEGTTFTVTVDCPSQGTPLAGFPKTFIFDDTGLLTSGTLPITGIPTDTVCKVEETGAGGADSVSYKVNGGSASSNAPTPTIVEDATQTVAVTNTFNEPETGSLTVTKTVVGPVPAEATFTVTVTCPADGAPLSGFPKTFAFDSNGALTSGVLPIAGIPTGTECKVEETGKGGADSVMYQVNGGGSSATVPTVTIATDGTQTVAVTNTFDVPPTGSLTVTKTVEGPVPGGAQFTVTVNCPSEGVPLPGFPKTFTFDSTGSLTSGTLPMTGIPEGTVCRVEETGKGGATSVAYAVNGGSSSATVPTPTIVAEATQTVAVTNTFIEVGGEFSGRVNIEKKITGVPPAEGTQFVVNVSCTGPTVSVDQDVTLTYSSQLTGSVAFNAPSDETVTCTVTERDPLGGAVSASIGPNNGVVVVTLEAPVADVVVTNHYGEPPVEVEGVVVTDTLPFTGSATDAFLKSAAWLLGIGGVFLLVSRTRRRRKLLA